MRQSIILNNFNLEMDFCFKKLLKDTPLKVTKMEISNTIKVDDLTFDLTMSEVKLILDIVDIYIQMVSAASVKNRIMHILLDKEFLKSNLLYLGSSQEETAKEQLILLLFQE